MPLFARVKADCWQHPKFKSCSLEAKALWLRGLLHCVTHQTDHIPEEELLHDSDRAPIIAAELVDAGLWHYADAGWIVHDFYQWNPRPDRRDQLADAVRRGAGISDPGWARKYAANISAGALESDITVEEVEAITRHILEQWATGSKPITGIPKFETILNARLQWRMSLNKRQNAATYLLGGYANDHRGGRTDPGPALHSLAEGDDPGGG